MMDKQTLIRNIASLARIEIDVCYANGSSEVEAREHLVRIRQDHERHVAVLGEIVRGLGGNAPELSSVGKEPSIQGFVCAADATSAFAALTAIKCNEELVEGCYREAAIWDVPEEASDVLADYLRDTQRHVRMIQELLDEQAGRAGRVA